MDNKDLAFESLSEEVKNSLFSFVMETLADVLVPPLCEDIDDLVEEEDFSPELLDSFFAQYSLDGDYYLDDFDFGFDWEDLRDRINSESKHPIPPEELEGMLCASFQIIMEDIYEEMTSDTSLEEDEKAYEAEFVAQELSDIAWSGVSEEQVTKIYDEIRGCLSFKLLHHMFDGLTREQKKEGIVTIEDLENFRATWLLKEDEGASTRFFGPTWETFKVATVKSTGQVIPPDELEMLLDLAYDQLVNEFYHSGVEGILKGNKAKNTH
jgi:hypothetical protein